MTTEWKDELRRATQVTSAEERRGRTERRTSSVKGARSLGGMFSSSDIVELERRGTRRQSRVEGFEK